MSDQTEPVVVISRYCPTCKAQQTAWKFDGRREDGSFVERCIDCGSAELSELRETRGKLHS